MGSIQLLLKQHFGSGKEYFNYSTSLIIAASGKKPPSEIFEKPSCMRCFQEMVLFSSLLLEPLPLREKTQRITILPLLTSGSFIMKITILSINI